MADRRLEELKEAINKFKMVIEHAKKAGKEHSGTAKSAGKRK